MSARWSRMQNARGDFVPGLLQWRSALVFDARAMTHLSAYCPGLPVIPGWVQVSWRRGPWAAVAPVVGARLDCTHHRTQRAAKAHVLERYRAWDESFQRPRSGRSRERPAKPSPRLSLEPMEALVAHFAGCQACQLTGTFGEWVICPEADALELQLGDGRAARLGDLVNRVASEVRWAARQAFEAERDA